MKKEYSRKKEGEAELSQIAPDGVGDVAEILEKEIGADIETQEKEPVVEELGPRGLAFAREHINVDVGELVFFNPRWELMQIGKKVAAVPKEQQSEERRKLMVEFKERFKKFRENLAQVQIEVEDILRADPDGSPRMLRRKVLDVLELRSVQFERGHFKKALREFTDGRRDMMDIVENFKRTFSSGWERELFRQLFNFSSRGKIEIEILPLAIYVRIYEKDDFVDAYTDFGNKPRNLALERERNYAEYVGAAYLDRVLVFPELNNKVIIENTAEITSVNPSDRAGVERRHQELRIHEEEHAIHKLYPSETFQIQRSFQHDLFSRFSGRVSVKELNIALNELAEVFVLTWEKYAQSEILARLKEGETVVQVMNIMLDNNGLYNYFLAWGCADEFAKIVVTQGAMIKEVQGDSGMIYTDIGALARSFISGAWEGNYKDNLFKVFSAMRQIIGGMNSISDKRVLRLLSQEPLRKWPRLAKLIKGDSENNEEKF